MAHPSALPQTSPRPLTRLREGTTDTLVADGLRIRVPENGQEQLLNQTSIGLSSGLSPALSHILSPSGLTIDRPTIWHSLSQLSEESVRSKCRKIRDHLDAGTESVDSLYLLLLLLDIDCIRCLATSDSSSRLDLVPILDQGLISGLVLALFKRCHDFHGHIDQHSINYDEIRLRALVSALTLLRYHGSTHIRHKLWQQLQTTKSQLLQDSQRSQSTTAGISSYLALLAIDYLDTFTSDQTIYAAVFGKVVNIACVVGLSFQYDVRRILEELQRAFEPLPRKRNLAAEHKFLFSLYEITRVMEYTFFCSKNAALSLEVQTFHSHAAAALAELSFRHTWTILDSEEVMKSQSQNLFVRVTRNVMNSSIHLDSQNYFYGILDNATRVARYVDIRALTDQDLILKLYRRLLEIILESLVPEYRAKACEILLVNNKAREKNYSDLLQTLDKSERSFKDTHRRQIRNIFNSCNDHDSYYDQKIWRPIQASIASSHTSPRPYQPASSIQNPDNFIDEHIHHQKISHITDQALSLSESPNLLATEMMNSSSESKLISPNSSPPSSHSQFNGATASSIDVIMPPNGRKSETDNYSDHDHSLFRNKSSGTHMTDSRTHSVSTAAESVKMAEFHESYSVHRYKFPLDRGSLLNRRSYLSSTISRSGNLILYRAGRHISIYKTPKGRDDNVWKQPIMKLKAPTGKLIKGAALSDVVIAILTTDPPVCYLHYISQSASDTSQIIGVNCIWEISEPHFSPMCVDINRKGDILYVAVGWRGTLFQNDPGKVTFHYYNLTDKHDSLNRSRIFNLELRDPPKNLSFSTNGNLICCSTLKYNLVRVWNITGAPEYPEPILVCNTNRPFSPDSSAEGITSITGFENPAHRPSRPYYIFCTTSWSSERIENEGELPFLAPAIQEFPDFNSDEFHCLDQFAHEERLVAGSVPLSGNVAAILDEAGRVMLVPFTIGFNGCLISRKTTLDRVRIKEGGTCNLNGGKGSILFEPSGRQILAADNDGHLLILEFTHENTNTINNPLLDAQS